MAEPSEMEVTNPEGLDAIFRAHYERIARVIGRFIHDQARAEELAVEVFLKWWRNPQAHGEQAEGWLYRTAVREALDQLRRQIRRSRFERRMAQKFAAHPAWLLDMPTDAVVNVQELALRAGPALLIEDIDVKGAIKRATVVRSTSERTYSVSSTNRELSMKITEALP